MIYRHSGNVFNFSKVNLKSSVLFLLIHFHKGLYLLIIIIHLLFQNYLQYPLPSVRFTPLATTLSLDKIFSYLLHSFCIHLILICNSSIFKMNDISATLYNQFQIMCDPHKPEIPVSHTSLRTSATSSICL